MCLCSKRVSTSRTVVSETSNTRLSDYRKILCKRSPGLLIFCRWEIFLNTTKKKPRGKNCQGCWSPLFARGTHRTNTQARTLPRTLSAGTHDVGPKQHVREIIQEAEEGRLATLAPFAAKGAMTPKSRAKREVVIQEAEVYLSFRPTLFGMGGGCPPPAANAASFPNRLDSRMLSRRCFRGMVVDRSTKVVLLIWKACEF